MAMMNSPFDAIVDSNPSTTADRRETKDVGGLLVTCGKVESVVKIWDYTHVDGNGACGRCGMSAGHQ